MSNFDDIRPYHDDEVQEVLQRIVHDDECLSAVIGLRLPRCPAFFKPVIKKLATWYLVKQVEKIHTVDAFQLMVKSHLERMVKSKITHLTSSGLERLDKNKAYLFISNHRDIALDPALINYILYHQGFPTLRIAIGDNLLKKPFVADLMRLNKSFIVQRSIKAPKKLFAALKNLSLYIRYSLTQEKAVVWIAQREGRAKDGLDKTDPTVIKMLTMSQNKKEESFSDVVSILNIVPVSISYEFDPCDEIKAQEIFQKNSAGFYEKREDEDVLSIAKGITGEKGRVHIAFGKPLNATYQNAEEVAAAIDKHIIDSYKLFPSNVLAWEVLQHQDVASEWGVSVSNEERMQFFARLALSPEELQPFILQMYANAIESKMALSR